MDLYFNERTWTKGLSDILNSKGEKVGVIDLKSAWTSSIAIYDASDALICTGNFRTFSLKWDVKDAKGKNMGTIRDSSSFFKRKYQYETEGRGVYTIEIAPFMGACTVVDAYRSIAATFQQINGWLQADAFRLRNHSPWLNHYELIAIIFGMHQINKIFDIDPVIVT